MFACEKMLHRKKGRRLFSASLQMMKKGFIKAIQREQNHGNCPVMLLCRWLGRLSTFCSFAVFFVGSRLCNLYWDVETDRNPHWERYRFKLVQVRQPLCKTLPQYEQRLDKVILRHDSAWPHTAESAQTYLGTMTMKVTTYPAISHRYCNAS